MRLNPTNFIAWLAERALEPLPSTRAHNTMLPQDVDRPEAKNAPADARKSAVLMLLYEELEVFNIVLIVRSKDGGPHSGQLALPGGKKEEADMNLVATAFRESQEEISLNQDAAIYVATLSPIYIPISNFLVTPIVAYSNGLPKLKPSDSEVAEIRYVPLQDMFDTVTHVEVSTMRGLWSVKAYTLNDGAIVWGATAMMLAELGILWQEYLKLRMPE